MKRSTIVAVLAVLATGCGKDTFPPQACFAASDQDLFIGETELVALCYNDPEGDEITVTATSSDLNVVEAAVQGGARAVLLEGIDAGQATISLVARDATGLEAPEQVFTVTVPNRDPEATEFPEVTLTNDVPEATLTLTDYFADPDDHELMFSAAVSDEEVIRATVNGATLEIEAVGGGTATVRVTATDPHGAIATADVEVSIRLTVELVNEDFSTLDRWTIEDATAEIVSGRLRLRPSHRPALAIVSQDLDASTEWSVTANVEWEHPKMWPSIMIATGGDPSHVAVLIGGDIRLLTGNSSLEETNLAIGYFSASLGRWVSNPTFVGMYSEIALETAADIGVHLGPETLSVLVNGTQIHEVSRRPEGFDIDLPGTIDAIAMVAWEAPLQATDDSVFAYFDWARVTGILTGAARRNEETRVVAPSSIVQMPPAGVWRIHR